MDKGLSKELILLPNASGGKQLYLGVTDTGKIKGIEISNRLKSQIQDLAHNCDPKIILNIAENNNILVIKVEEGVNKPYSCSAGFFMRMGANSQKMTRNEILALAVKSGKIRYLMNRFVPTLTGAIRQRKIRLLPSTCPNIKQFAPGGNTQEICVCLLMKVLQMRSPLFCQRTV